MKRLIYLLLLLTMPLFMQAQLMDRIMRKTQEKVEDRAAERISDEADKSAEKALDEMFREKETEQSSSTEAAPQRQDQVHSGAAMDTGALNSMLRSLTGSMDKTGEVPESYEFDLVLDMLIESDGEKPQTMSMMYNKEGKFFGVRTVDNKGGSNTVVMDQENNLNCMFMEDKKGKKTGMAMPNMMSAFGQYASTQVAEEVESDQVSFRKTGKTKTVAGYRCDEYEAESSESSALIYVSKELDVDYRNMMQGMFGEQFNMSLPDVQGDIQGAFLETISTEKKNGKVSKMTTTAVHKQGASLRKADYEFSSMGGK